MTGPIQCINCGAVLLKEDIFCGECGAPRPSETSPAEAIAEPHTEVMEEPRPDPLPEPRPVRRPDSDTIWRVAAAVLGIVGVLVCLLGLAAFLLFGLIEAEDMTPAENWLLSTICCLLPIAGTGVAMAVAGLVIWWAKLRNR
jgi:hypothetical protein